MWLEVPFWRNLRRTNRTEILMTKIPNRRCIHVFKPIQSSLTRRRKQSMISLGQRSSQSCHEDLHSSFHFQGLRAGELLESFDRVNRVTFFLLNVSGALRDPTIAWEAWECKFKFSEHIKTAGWVTRLVQWVATLSWRQELVWLPLLILWLVLLLAGYWLEIIDWSNVDTEGMCFPGLLQDHWWGETLVPQLREKGVCYLYNIIGAARSYVVTERVQNTIISLIIKCRAKLSYLLNPLKVQTPPGEIQLIANQV